jgi:hypothetical protein
MRKFSIGLLCVALCIAIAFIWNSGVAFEYIMNIEDDCLACHNLGSTLVPDDHQFAFGTEWHDNHQGFAGNDCAQCHFPSPGAVPVPVPVGPDGNGCFNCHPFGGDECEWKVFHEENQTYLDNVVGPTCYECHPECEPMTSTTTTADVTSTTTTADVTSTTTTMDVTTTTTTTPGGGSIEAEFSGCGSPFLIWFGVVGIQGTDTEFGLTSIVRYSSPLVFKLPKLPNRSAQTITQLVLLWPSILFPVLDYPATVTVSVDTLSDTIDIPACGQ